MVPSSYRCSQLVFGRQDATQSALLDILCLSERVRRHGHLPAIDSRLLQQFRFRAVKADISIVIVRLALNRFVAFSRVIIRLSGHYVQCPI